MIFYRKNGTSYTNEELEEAYEIEMTMSALAKKPLGSMIVYDAYGHPRALHICQTDECADAHDALAPLADEAWGLAERNRRPS